MQRTAETGGMRGESKMKVGKLLADEQDKHLIELKTSVLQVIAGSKGKKCK